MESALIKYKVRENHQSKVQDWVVFFNSNKAEISKSLFLEGIWVESVFFESEKDNNFIYYYVRATNLKIAIEIFKASKNSCDLYHKDFMTESLEYVGSLAVLIDIDRIN